MFITAEYRRGLIRVTLAACPRRGRVLAAKAVVTGLVAFAAALAGTAVAVPLGQRVLRSHGVYLPPLTALTETRMIVGTAAALAVCAVLAVAIGTVARRGAAAVAAVIALIAAPYVLTVSIPVLPLGAADWLMRVTPAAAFAVEQTVVQYPQVDDVYAPAYGYFPLAPWAGFAVLCAWTAVFLTLAAVCAEPEGRVRRAIRAEWAKAWSDPAVPWLLAALVVLTMAVSGVTIGTARCPAAACGQDPARISLAGVYLGQAVAALAGVLALGGEYATGMIHVTLTAIPRRRRLLAAKALVLGGPVLVASALALGAATLAGVIVLPGHGFTAGHGYDLASWATARAWCCATVYLTLVAVLGLGVTAIVRDSAVATGVVLGLLYLFPIAAMAIGDQAVARRLEQIGPMSAGLDSQTTIDLHGLPLAPWAGLGVVALWAAGALALGGVLLWLRDA